MKKCIRMDLISVDAQIQQRSIDNEVVSRYVELMRDGVEFPPVEVVFDGKDHFLWDGFHRYQCALKLGRTTLPAHVTNGTRRDALWLSFSANKDHGLPRQPGVARHIIETILTDTNWSKKTLTSIARHVGVTKQYVSLVKAELAQTQSSTKISDDKKPHSGAATGEKRKPHSEAENGEKDATSLPINERKPHSEAENSEKGSSTLPLLRDEKVEVKSSRGRTYTQRSQEKRHEPQELPKDAVGRVIPEHLRELYEGRKTISEFVAALTKMKNGLMKHIEARDPVFSLLNVTAFQSQYDTLRATLKGAMPYCICVYCGGDGKDCKACRGLGLLNKSSYQFAPRELK